MDALLREKIEEVERNTWKLKFSEHEVPARSLAEPVLSVIGLVNQHLGSAAAGDPCASLAWSGVTLILQLLLNPCEQAVALAAGIEYVARLIARSRMWEDLYEQRYGAASGSPVLSPTSHVEYKTALGELYVTILKYQMTCYDYYSRNSAFRLGLDMIKAYDWESLLQEIRDREDHFTAVSAAWRDMKYDEECQAVKDRCCSSRYIWHAESLERWDAIGLRVQGLREAVTTAADDKERGALLDWLCDVDPSVSYNTARESHREGTGNWLLASLPFKRWESSPRSLLWLHGKAGSGKTILSSVVIKHLRDKYQDLPDTALVYFYFTFSDATKQNAPAMISSLVKQLCCCRPDTPRPINDLVRYKERGERPDLLTLEAAFVAAARGFSKVFIVVDGLDESPTLRGERKRVLDSIRRLIAAVPDCVSLFCTSRPERDIEIALEALLQGPSRESLSLSGNRPELDDDIKLCISSALASEDFGSWPEEVKIEATEKLMQNADGMMQYVACQLDTLRHLGSVAEVQAALHNLPLGLDAAYDRILLTLASEPGFHKEPVRSLLMWLCVTDSPIRVFDLAEIYIFTLHPYSPGDNLSTRRFFDARMVLKHLGSLVIVQDYNKDSMVRLAHFSIKEYLTSPRAPIGFSFSEPDAYLRCAYQAIKYFAEVTCEAGWDGNDWAPSDSNPLVRSWASVAVRAPVRGCGDPNRWLKYLRTVPPRMWSHELMNLVNRVLLAGSYTLCRICCEWAYGFHTRTSKDGCFADSPRGHPLLLASSIGHLQLTDVLVSSSEYWIQADFDLALQWAAFFHHPGVAKILLDRGADVNSRGEPLLAAVAGINEPPWADPLVMVKLLVKRGANINQRSSVKAHESRPGLAHRWAKSPVATAALAGHFDTVKYLLECGASVCMEGECGVAAAATQPNKCDILKLLLDASKTGCKHLGALETAIRHRRDFYDDRRHGKFGPAISLLLERATAEDLDTLIEHEGYPYPLFAACATGQLDLVHALVEKGADLHIRDGGRYGTALHVACASRTRLSKTGSACQQQKRKLIKYLLDQGMDPNAQAGDLGYPLQAACLTSADFGIFEYRPTNTQYPENPISSQHPRCDNVVELLLRRGASINGIGGIFGTALQAAAIGSYNLETFKCLLAQGADPNLVAGEYSTALQAAALGGCFDKVSLLLEHGAEIVQGGRYGSPLQATSVEYCAPKYFRGLLSHDALRTLDRSEIEKDKIFDVLLERESSLSSGGEFGTALHAAAVAAWLPEEEWIRRISRLLEAGFDINDTRGNPDEAVTALHGLLRSNVPNKDCFRKLDFLLSHGSNPCLSAGTCGQPLQALCSQHFPLGRFPDVARRVRYLLDRCPSIDVNAQGGLFGCALQAVERYRKFWSVQKKKKRQAQ
ncbi:hypothetical protein VTJ83DRAFT_4395 [Remersonia thermophila]|uniref:NACHT domain-containing protein n=1 Tax=Remersonia thermophila TaxID=72144 RepID=A0ABR4D9W4_9PEZI